LLLDSIAPVFEQGRVGPASFRAEFAEGAEDAETNLGAPGGLGLGSCIVLQPREDGRHDREQRSEMTRALVFDPFAGISGDMTVAALVDLGLPVDWLTSFVRSLGIAHVDVRVERVMRRGISCARVVFDTPEQHAHRHLRHVLEIIERTNASVAAKERAADAFRRIAEAEARIHGTTIEKVHFHEVGALDAILDILCVMAGVEELRFEAFFTRPVAVGSGWVEIEHGRFPVPAPATAELLSGIPVTGQDLAGECTTPTGAAIVAVLTGGRRPPEGLTVDRTGFGAGTRDPDDRPNCLRLLACSVGPLAPAGQARPVTGGGEEASLFVVQTDIDDLAPEYLPPARDALFEAGALDVTIVSVAMKKGRPGIRLEALAPASSLEAVTLALFHNTPTLGVRYWPVRRTVLARSEDVIEWRGQRIRRKRVRLPDGRERAKPEYEDVVQAARALGLTPLEVRSALDGEDVT
jgi:uncharacterized protein (TIGR00299 family) protein